MAAPIGKVKTCQFNNPTNSTPSTMITRSNSQTQISRANLALLATTPRFTVPTSRNNTVNDTAVSYILNNASPIQMQQMKEKKMKNETEIEEQFYYYNEWITPNIINLTPEFNASQLSFALCHSIMENKQFGCEINNYNNIYDSISEYKINGQYRCKYFGNAQKQLEVNKIKENEIRKQQLKKQSETPWKYKNINELEVNEISEMI